MATCLFCQEQNPAGLEHCAHCGMALPKQQEAHRQRGLRRFIWFVIGLSLFCAFAILWFGRTPPTIG